jgi:hypothetical protein
MEFDRSKLPASIELAEKAIHQRLRVLPIAHSKEHRELKDALNSLTVLKRMLYIHRRQTPLLFVRRSHLAATYSIFLRKGRPYSESP